MSRAASVKACFYRGGTSRGLFFRTRDLAPFTQRQRDAIICNAMGSPDPDGRQITGLGGGLSSLSKCAVIGPAGEGARGSAWPAAANPLVRPDDVEASKRKGTGWNVVYRFGQVPINDTVIDWGSTCGNLVAAAAQFAIDSGSIPQVTLTEFLSHCGSAPYPVRIFAANSGNIVTAHVQLEWSESQEVRAARTGTSKIAGVPGSCAPINIETPLPEPSTVLPSGRARDTIALLDATKVDVSLVDCGLPVIFVAAPSLGISSETLLSHPAELDAQRSIMDKLEHVRREGGKLSEKVWNNFSPSAPKVCIVDQRRSYKTTANESIDASDMDLLIRSISVGNVHRTIPATTLSAVAAASAFTESIVSEAIAQGGATPAPASTAESQGQEHVRSVTVGQPAGLSMASVKVDPTSGGPIGIVYLRTANRIMTGFVDVPTNL